MAADSWENINEQVKSAWKKETTPFERVYEIIEQTHHGQSAADIAERALVSEPTARRHVTRAVHAGWRIAYEHTDVSRLNKLSNPP